MSIFNNVKEKIKVKLFVHRKHKYVLVDSYSTKNPFILNLFCKCIEYSVYKYLCSIQSGYRNDNEINIL